MGPGLGILPLQEIKGPHRLCQAFQIPIPVPGTISALLSLLKTCVSYGTWQTPLWYLSLVGRGQVSFHCSTRQFLAGETLAMKDQGTLTEADLALSLLSVVLSNVWLWGVWVCVCVFGDSDTKMKWSEGCLESSLGFGNQSRVLGLISGVQYSALQ